MRGQRNYRWRFRYADRPGTGTIAKLECTQLSRCGSARGPSHTGSTHIDKLASTQAVCVLPGGRAGLMRPGIDIDQRNGSAIGAENTQQPLGRARHARQARKRVQVRARLTKSDDEAHGARDHKLAQVTTRASAYFGTRVGTVSLR